jgi:hypothetical protein
MCSSTTTLYQGQLAETVVILTINIIMCVLLGRAYLCSKQAEEGKKEPMQRNRQRNDARTDTTSYCYANRFTMIRERYDFTQTMTVRLVQHHLAS